jgi:DNA primase
MAHQFDCTNVVATLGTSVTAGHGRILRRYAKKVVLIFDSDTAGIEAANRALEVCLSQRIDIKLASVPKGKDPCDYLLAAGKEPFEQLADKAVDVFQFKWNRLTESLGSDDTLAGRKSAIEEFLQTIAAGLWAGKLPPLDRGLVLNRLSKIVGLDIKELNAELSRRVGRVAKTASYGVENRKVQTIDYGQGLFATAQREVLEVLLGSRLAGALNETELFEIAKQKITAELFDVPILRQTAAILFETLNAEPKPSLAEMLARVESIELGECLVQLAQAGEEKGNFHARLTGALDAIERYQARRKKSRIKEVEDKRQFLRRVHENTGKENPHNVGMV